MAYPGNAVTVSASGIKSLRFSRLAITKSTRPDISSRSSTLAKTFLEDVEYHALCKNWYAMLQQARTTDCAVMAKLVSLDCPNLEEWEGHCARSVSLRPERDEAGYVKHP